MPLSRDVGVLVRWPLYHGFRAFGWPAMRPLTMSFVLTDRCNSRCATCSIGARYLDDPSVADGELSLAEYERLFASIGPLEWVTLSGGEPFMRKDLADVALALVRHTRPRVVNVPTNGTIVDAAVRTIERMLEGFGATRLILNVSVDGVGAAHDTLRGFDGNFERLLTLTSRLRAIDDPRLVLGCNTVVSRFNAERVPSIVDHVLEHIAPDSYVLEAAQIRPEYYNEAARPAGDAALVEAALRHALSRIGAQDRRGVASLVKAFRQSYYRRAIARLHAPAPHRCFRAFATCAVMPKGEVVASTERAEPMGNVRDFDLDFGALWEGARARAARDAVRGERCACEASNVSYPNALLDPAQMVEVAWHALKAQPLPSRLRRRRARPGGLPTRGER